jgi:hypothetical protein
MDMGNNHIQNMVITKTTPQKTHQIQFVNNFFNEIKNNRQ